MRVTLEEFSDQRSSVSGVLYVNWLELCLRLALLQYDSQQGD